MFVVPHDTTRAQLTLGEQSAEVEIPDVTPLPPLTPPEPGVPAKFVRIEVLETKLVDQCTGQHTVGHERYDTTITNPQGKLLEVRFALTPTRGNKRRGDVAYFSRSTDDMGLMYGEGTYVIAAGEEMVNRMRAHVSGSLQPRDGKWPTGEHTVWFAVPADISNCQLTYQGTPVVEIVPGGPYQAIPVK
jgi:hypothetical protein